jgi:hypothetical protein
MRNYYSLIDVKDWNKWFFLLLLVGLVSCVDQIELDLQKENQNLAINGFITNFPDPYLVFIRYAGNYGESVQEENPVTGAQVQIISSNGSLANLEEIRSGVYETNPSNFVGQVGNRYHLAVVLPDGSHYISEPEELLPVPPIFDLNYKYYEEQVINAAENISFQKRIDILLNTHIPANPENVFFKWDVKGEYEFRESEALTDIFAYTGVGPVLYTCYIPHNIRLGDVTVFDGGSIQGKLLRDEVIKTIDVDYKFAFNYCVHVKQSSLTKEAFSYWNKVEKTLNRNGLLLEESVGKLNGNISNVDDPSEQVSGYFYASAIQSNRMFIPRDSVGRPVSNCILVDSAFVEACMDCLTIHHSTRERPSYWPF